MCKGAHKLGDFVNSQLHFFFLTHVVAFSHFYSIEKWPLIKDSQHQADFSEPLSNIKCHQFQKDLGEFATLEKRLWSTGDPRITAPETQSEGVLLLGLTKEFGLGDHNELRWLENIQKIDTCLKIVIKMQEFNLMLRNPDVVWSHLKIIYYVACSYNLLSLIFIYI